MVLHKIRPATRYGFYARIFLMFKTKLFWELIFLGVIVAILNSFAVAYDLYWSVYELDSLVHFLAGALVAIFFLWLYFFSGIFSPPKRNLWTFLKIAFLGSIFVAVSWEVYELILGEAVIQKAEYPYDTTLDFIMDALGIVGASFYAYLKELESIKTLIKSDGQ